MPERPKFHEWLKAKLGPKWVVARRTKRTLARYPTSTFITMSRFQALKDEYEAAWGPAYKKITEESWRSTRRDVLIGIAPGRKP